MANKRNKGKAKIVSDGIFENTDAIIIGAGVGGLSAAAYLAQAGRRVLVLEQDSHLGGTAHIFRRSGFTFPTGPQSVTVPDYIAHGLRELGIERSLSFKRDCFQVRRGNLDVMISVPLHQLSKQLMDHFPEEKKGIRAVIKILEDVIDALDVLQPDDLIEQGSGCRTDGNACAVIERWGRVPARDLIESNVQDQTLKDLLGSQGTSETVMSVVLLAQMWRFMSRVGIWYITEGIDSVPELLADRVRSFGGDIRLGERVVSILVKEGAAAGVELAGGTIIKAPFVISDADYRETIIGLLPPDVFLGNEKEEISRMPLTSSAFSVFLGVKRGLIDLSAFRGDHLMVKLKEGKPLPWEMKKPVPEDFMKDEIWLSWWSNHDPALAPPGCEALIIKVEAPYDMFAPFSGGCRGCHQEHYYSLKEEMADALVSAASNVLPGLPGAVVVREVATPLTYKFWGHRSEGSVAGWSWRSGEKSEPWTRSLAVTKVPGLLMVGLQSFTRLFYGGMGTSIYSGKYASDLVLAC